MDSYMITRQANPKESYKHSAKVTFIALWLYLQPFICCYRLFYILHDRFSGPNGDIPLQEMSHSVVFCARIGVTHI